MSDPAPEPPPPARADAIRRFNRFYTRRIGVLREGLLDSKFTLTESRLLWELAHAPGTTAAQLADALELDPGYLSRLLRGFKERGLLRTVRSTGDARAVVLSLTAAGRRAFDPLDRRSREQVEQLLATLPEAHQLEVVQAMSTIERLLDDDPGRAARRPYLLRGPRAGDMGWVVARHGALYAQEYRWAASFEALVARIVADFVDRFDASRELCWMAERDGANVGCVFLIQARDEATGAPLEGVAQLRLLLVEPAARGLGIGGRLVAECSAFARRAGYQRIRLWTNSILGAARHLYRKEGYAIVASEPHRSFGHDLVGETWELPLG